MPGSKMFNKISCSLPHSELITNKVDSFERSEIGFSYRQMTALYRLKICYPYFIYQMIIWYAMQDSGIFINRKNLPATISERVEIKAQLSILVFNTRA